MYVRYDQAPSGLLENISKYSRLRRRRSRLPHLMYEGIPVQSPLFATIQVGKVGPIGYRGVIWNGVADGVQRFESRAVE